MKVTKLFAPQIDTIISGFSPENNPITRATYLKLKNIYFIFSLVKPGNDDEIRHIWFEVERGPIEAFGCYEEFKQDGEVESPEEFEQTWKDYYPQETKWYIFKTSKYSDNIFLSLNDKLFSIIKEEDQPLECTAPVSDSFEIFINWLQERILVEMSKLRKDPAAFNCYIHKNLSYTKRFGRIRRKDYWDILGDNAYRPDKDLGEEEIEKLKTFLLVRKKSRALLSQKMTANKFFRMCEICYNANDYFKKTKRILTPT